MKNYLEIGIKLDKLDWSEWNLSELFRL